MSDPQNFKTRFDGPKDLSRLGQSIAYGDVNGDGFDDIIIGAPGTDFNSRDRSGSFYLISGFSHVPVEKEIDLTLGAFA